MLSSNRNNRSSFCYCALDELFDLFEVLQGFFLRNNVNLVLNNHHIFHADNVKGHKVLLGLGLGTGFVSCDHKQGSIHKSCSRKHCGHKRLVSGRVNKRNGPKNLGFRTVHRTLLLSCIALSIITLGALSKSCIRIAEANRNPPLQLLGVHVSPDT